MKKSKMFLIMVLGLLAFSVLGCEKEKVIGENELPPGIKTYLEIHFPTCGITKIVKDKENKELSYDITLDCGVNIEFNGKSQVIDVDGTSQLPNSVIPDKILNYTSTHYPNDYIIGWELEGKNQQVELNTYIELEFDMAGNFMRIVE